MIINIHFYNELLNYMCVLQAIGDADEYGRFGTIWAKTLRCY